MKNKKINKKGFTLVEMLISTSVFVLVALASLSIYSETLRASQETLSLTRIQQEAQLLMQVMAKKVRTSRVDYDYYSGIDADGDNDLALVDTLGDEYIFKKDTNTLLVSVNGGDDVYIPADHVSIDSFKVYINPTTNPYSLDEPPASQPYVTIVMEISASKGRQENSLTVQQTIPQRSGLVE
jgi:prepilin-type N-terminal cleavage/methylation domain-containing protein